MKSIYQTIQAEIERAQTAMQHQQWDAAAQSWQTIRRLYKGQVPENVYVMLARMYRLQNRLEQAEAALRRGIQKYPYGIAVHTEYAELARAENDLQEETRRMKKVKELNKSFADAQVVMQQADMLCRQGAYEKAEKLLCDGAARYPDILQYVFELAEISFLQQKWLTAARYYRVLVIRMRDHTPAFIYQRMAAALHKNADKALTLKTYAAVSGPAALAAQAIYDDLAAGNVDNAQHTFRQLITSLFDDRATRDDWVEAFTAICGLFDDTLSAPAAGLPDETRRPYRKLIVSGMYWSGSGALFDYFREFADIVTIREEFPHFSGQPSFKSMRQSCSDLAAFRRELLQFFGLGLLGLGKVSNHDQYRMACLTRCWSLRSPARALYARSAGVFCTIMQAIGRSGDASLPRVQHAVTVFMDALADLQGATSSSLCLYDNVIKIPNLAEIDYLSHTTLMCSFRDPRTNYVALVTENSGFINTTAEFIRNYRAVRQNAETAVKALPTRRDAVHFVQFEPFVLSENYRRSVAQAAGLNLSGQSRYRYFKPWISRKNVYNYREFPDQKAISAIEAELGEYCWKG